MSPKTKYTEQELVDALLLKSEAAFSYLYDNYSGALFSIINQIVTDRETASDVLQEVFTNIWKKIDSYDAAKGRLYTWMLNIARNASIDKVRSKALQNSLRNQTIPDDVSTFSAMSHMPVEKDTGLRKVLTRLKEEHRTLIDLSYFQGFTHEEIAKITEIPLGTVKTRIRSALTQLKIMLQ